MSTPWRVRVARNAAADRLLLHRFHCATSSQAWDTEVERFIQTELFDWAFEPLARSAEPRLLLLFERGRRALVGVAAHERTVLVRNDAAFAATKLEVAAFSIAWHGRAFEGGPRASDILMSAALTDIAARVPPRDARVFAVVHKDNQRSLALAHRHGFVHELEAPDPAYRRLLA